MADDFNLFSFHRFDYLYRNFDDKMIVEEINLFFILLWLDSRRDKSLIESRLRDEDREEKNFLRLALIN